MPWSSGSDFTECCFYSCSSGFGSFSMGNAPEPPVGRSPNAPKVFFMRPEQMPVWPERGYLGNPVSLRSLIDIRVSLFRIRFSTIFHSRCIGPVESTKAKWGSRPMSDSLTFRLLRYIKASAETLNFRRAAEQVFVAQSSLSHQIGKLENNIDVTIFDRPQDPLKVTAWRDSGVSRRSPRWNN
jgi:Bacterial regulatory helix-turn-helix protein, lysR family